MWENKNKEQAVFKGKKLTIVVTHYVGYGDEYVMHCYNLGIRQRVLGTTELERAKFLSETIVRDLLTAYTEDLVATRNWKQQLEDLDHEQTVW